VANKIEEFIFIVNLLYEKSLVLSVVCLATFENEKTIFIAQIH
jgi:hypothetical protein